MASIGNPGIPGPGGRDVVALVVETQEMQVTIVVEVPVIVVDPVKVVIVVEVPVIVVDPVKVVIVVVVDVPEVVVSPTT